MHVVLFCKGICTHQLDVGLVSDDGGDDERGEDEDVAAGGDDGEPAVVGVLVRRLVVGLLVEARPGQDQHDDVDALQRKDRFDWRW